MVHATHDASTARGVVFVQARIIRCSCQRRESPPAIFFLYNIILKLLAYCEPRNGPGKALVVADSIDDGSFAVDQSKGVLCSLANNLSLNWFLSGVHAQLVDFLGSVVSSKAISQCANESIGLGRARFDPGFPTTSGLPGFRILTTRNLLDYTFDHLKICLKVGCNIDSDLFPVFY